jgi:hypothetical protein
MGNTAKKKTAPISDVSEVDLSTARRGKSRHAAKRLELPLAGVRTAVAQTQVAVAEASKMNQGDVSRLERRPLEEIEVGTLRRYLAAIGAELELVAVIGTTRIVIRSPEST